MATITAILGMMGLSMAMIGFCTKHLNILQRALFFAGGLCLIYPGTMTDIAGVAIYAVTYLWQRRNAR